MRASYILSGIFNENTKTFNIFYFDNKKIPFTSNFLEAFF